MDVHPVPVALGRPALLGAAGVLAVVLVAATVVTGSERAGPPA